MTKVPKAAIRADSLGDYVSDRVFPGVRVLTDKKAHQQVIRAKATAASAPRKLGTVKVISETMIVSRKSKALTKAE